MIYADAFVFRLVGYKGTVYYPYKDSNSCGSWLPPGRLYHGLYPGGRTEGNLCFEVPKTEDNFVLIYSPGGLLAQSWHYLRLDPNRLGAMEDLSEVSLDPTPDSLALPKGMKVDNPVEAGAVLTGPEGIEIVVTGFAENAYEVDPYMSLRKEIYDFPDPPQTDLQYVQVNLGITSTFPVNSQGARHSDFRLVGDGRIIYYRGTCPLINDSAYGGAFPGMRTEGNICFAVPSTEANFILIYGRDPNNAESWRFLKLDPIRVGSLADLSKYPVNVALDVTSLRKGTSFEYPLEAGSVLKGTDDTEVVVTDVMEYSEELIQAERADLRLGYESVPPPVDGYKRLLIGVGFANLSGDRTVNAERAAHAFYLVGDDRVVYGEECWYSIPKRLAGQLLPGGRVEGRICFDVPDSKDTFVLIHSPKARDPESHRFLVIDPLQSGSLADLSQVPPGRDPSLPRGTSIDNPLQAGTVLKGVEGTEVVVTRILEDAWEYLAEKGSVYGDPPTGFRYYLITVGLANISHDEIVYAAPRLFQLVGDNRVLYSFRDTFRTNYGEIDDYRCGRRIPNAIQGQLFPGGKVEGNICFKVPESEDNFVLIHSSRFLALDPLQVGAASDLSKVSLDPTPAALASPKGSRFDNPLEAGSLLQLPNKLEINVVGVVKGEAAREVLKKEQDGPSNDLPELGLSYYILRLKVSNVSDTESLAPYGGAFTLVGDKRIVYRGSNCVINDSDNLYRYARRLDPGATIEGSLCFKVANSDKNFILMSGTPPTIFLRV